MKIGKGKCKWIYITLFLYYLTLKAIMHGSRSYLHLHQCLPLGLLRDRSPDGAITDCNGGHLIAAYYLYPPRKDERLIRPGWLTYSGRFTHISGHPSTVGRAQDRESSPVKDQRTTAVPCN